MLTGRIVENQVERQMEEDVQIGLVSCASTYWRFSTYRRFSGATCKQVMRKRAGGARRAPTAQSHEQMYQPWLPAAESSQHVKKMCLVHASVLCLRITLQDMLSRTSSKQLQWLEVVSCWVPAG